MTIEIKNGKLNVYDLGQESNDIFEVNCVVDLIFNLENFYCEKYRYPHNFKELYLWLKEKEKDEELPFS